MQIWTPGCVGVTMEPMEDLDRRLDHAILSLLSERGPGKTICPSEAARAVFPAARNGRVTRPWRVLMEPAREAASRLAAAGQIDVTQKGEVVDIATARGPVRLRLRDAARNEPPR